MKRLFFILFSILISCNICLSSPEELSKQAVAFYSDNNYDRTMDMLLQIDEKQRSAQDWLLLGNLMDEKGEKNNAIFMYQKALNVDKKCYRAYYNLANIYLSQEKYNLAIENYKKASSIAEENPYIYYNLGCAYLKLGNAKKAKTAFINAITYKNTVPEFHYNLAYTYKSLGKTKLAETYLKNYNKLIAQ